MKRMLINVAHGVRVALINGNKLDNLEIERGQQQKVNNIYLGKVNRVEPSLGAAFVDYGSDRDGFLPSKEVAREYFKSSYKHTSGERPNIRETLESGQELIVQVVKEQRGNKGAALRTFISLAGRFLVLMPNNPRAGGISRQIEGEEREELKSNINQLVIPDGMGVIVRTAGLGRSLEELQWDFELLLSQWKAIVDASKNKRAPFLIYQESDVLTRALRDNLKPDIEEILIDDRDSFEKAKEHLANTRPEFVEKLKLYEGSDPLFNRFQVESQIESAYQRVVNLDNGASIVIDPTEALTAIDINSAKATEGSNIEETAYKTNLAAAKEIARQLRLRDIGGLIVIDFIDMLEPKNQRSVEKILREALQVDRARVQMGRISRFGLLEMSRQRLQPSLVDANQVTCPTCDGQGTIRGVESLTLSILRVIEEESMKAHASQIRTQVPVDVSTYLMNEKRDALLDIEKRHDVKVVVIANQTMSIPHYEVTLVKAEELGRQPKSSYKHATDHTPATPHSQTNTHAQPDEEPAIQHLSPNGPPPPRKLKKNSNLMRRLWDAVFKSPVKDEAQNNETEGDSGSLSKSNEKTKSSHQQSYGRQNDRYNNRNSRNKRGGKNRQGNRSKRPTQLETEAPVKETTEIESTISINAEQQEKTQNKGSRGQNQQRNQKSQNQNRQNTQGADKNQRKAKSQNQPTAHAGTRSATSEEMAMHESQTQETLAPQSSEGQKAKRPQKQQAKTQEKKPVVKQETAHIETTSVVEIPVIEKEEKEVVAAIAIPPKPRLTPEQAGFRQAERRDQIGFVKISEDVAKSSFVFKSNKTFDTSNLPSLKQVSTNADIKPVRMLAPPMSTLVRMPSKPKKVEITPAPVVTEQPKEVVAKSVAVADELPKVDAEQG